MNALRQLPDLHDYLHEPYRQIDDIEHHLRMARSLSRALFLLVNGQNAEGRKIDDIRDREALIQLVSEVGFHASAAEFAFQREVLEASSRLPKAPSNGASTDD